MFRFVQCVSDFVGSLDWFWVFLVGCALSKSGPRGTEVPRVTRFWSPDGDLLGCRSRRSTRTVPAQLLQQSDLKRNTKATTLERLRTSSRFQVFSKSHTARTTQDREDDQEGRAGPSYEDAGREGPTHNVYSRFEQGANTKTISCNKYCAHVWPRWSRVLEHARSIKDDVHEHRASC